MVGPKNDRIAARKLAALYPIARGFEELWVFLGVGIGGPRAHYETTMRIPDPDTVHNAFHPPAPVLFQLDIVREFMFEDVDELQHFRELIGVMEKDRSDRLVGRGLRHNAVRGGRWRICFGVENYIRRNSSEGRSEENSRDGGGPRVSAKLVSD